jgi:cell wall assembly regulator SMI1
LCIDLDPAEGGHVGQVITMWHDEPGREWIAGSFQEWLSLFVHQLNDDYFRYDPDMGNLERLKW